MLCKCYFVQHPGPKSILVSVCESSDTAPQPLPLCLHVFASIFQPLSSKQPQTPQLLINSPYLQNRHVSQHPICHLLDRPCGRTCTHVCDVNLCVKEVWNACVIYSVMCLDLSPCAHTAMWMSLRVSDDSGLSSSNQTTPFLQNFSGNKLFVTHAVSCTGKAQLYWA